MFKTLSLLTALPWMFMAFFWCSQVQAAEITERAALFEAPSTSSRQVQILESGTAVQIKGPEETAEGLIWIPVIVGGHTGYVRKALINDTAEGKAALADNSSASRNSEPPTVRMRLWGSEGLTFVSSNATSASSLVTTSTSYTGNRFVLGYDFNFGAALQLILGVSYEVFSSGESTADIGAIHRRASMFSVGYYLVPHLLYAKLSGGLQFVTADFAVTSVNGNVALAWEATLGLRLAASDHFNFGFEGTYESVQSVSTTPLFGTLIGSPSFPGENLFCLGLVIGFDLGRVR